MIYHGIDIGECRYNRGGDYRKKPIDHVPEGITGLIDFCEENVTKESVVLETGCFFAASTFIFSKFARFVISVDTRIRPEATQWIEECMPNVMTIVSDSSRVKSMLSGNKFDIVYLDTLHTEDHVSREIAELLPLVKYGGILAGHDYSTKPGYGVVQAIQKMLGSPDKVYKDSSWLKRIRTAMAKKPEKKANK